MADTDSSGISKLQTLLNVRKISDLNTLNINSLTDDNAKNSYIMTTTFGNNRYENFKIRLNEIIQIIQDNGNASMDELRELFDYYVTNFRVSDDSQTYLSIDQVVASNDYSNKANYSYVLSARLSQYLSTGAAEFFSKSAPSDGLVTGNMLSIFLNDFLEWIKGFDKSMTAYSYIQASIVNYITPIYDSIDEILHTFHNASINERKNKTITVGTKKYTLTVDDDSKLYIDEISDPYKPFTVEYKVNGTVCSNDYIIEKEYDSEVSTLSLSVKFNKNCTKQNGSDDIWRGVSNIAAETTKTASATYAKNTTSTFTLIVKENDEYITDASNAGFTHTADTITVKTTVKYNQFSYWKGISAELLDSNAPIADIRRTVGNKPLGTNSNGYATTQINFTSDDAGDNWGTSGKYLYLLLKQKPNSGSFSFIIGSGTTPGTLPGGMVKVKDVPDVYSSNPSNPIVYELWRTEQPMTGASNIKIS